MRVLKKRREFVRLNTAAQRLFQQGFVVQTLRHDHCEGQNSDSINADSIGIGFTATKRIGNAVTRNRAKRRLRALWQEAISDDQLRQKLHGFDIVLIAKSETPTLPYQNLLQSLQQTLQRAVKKQSASSTAK